MDDALVLDTKEEIFEMNNVGAPLPCCCLRPFQELRLVSRAGVRHLTRTLGPGLTQGCICCTVRGDLIRILTKLLKRKNKFDHIMIEVGAALCSPPAHEMQPKLLRSHQNSSPRAPKLAPPVTEAHLPGLHRHGPRTACAPAPCLHPARLQTTGLADPAPVAQTFFVDEDLKQSLRLDSILTGAQRCSAPPCLNAAGQRGSSSLPKGLAAPLVHTGGGDRRSPVAFLGQAPTSALAVPLPPLVPVVDAKHILLHLDEEKPDGVINESIQQVGPAVRRSCKRLFAK